MNNYTRARIRKDSGKPYAGRIYPFYGIYTHPNGRQSAQVDIGGHMREYDLDTVDLLTCPHKHVGKNANGKLQCSSCYRKFESMP